MYNPPVLIILSFLGLSFGSFVNALVWRLHEQIKQAKAKTPTLETKNLSIIKGRSMCVNCHHALAWYDLLPVVSWLTLGGRCRYCKKPISPQYPAVELLTATLFVFSYVAWPYGLSTLANKLLFVSWLITLVGLIALALYDKKWMLLPDKLTMPLTVFWAVLTVVLAVLEQSTGRIVGAIGGLVFCGGIFWVLFQVSKGKWIGGGDVKLGFLLGLIVTSPQKSLLLIFGASVLGLLWATPSMLKGMATTNSKIPFGPFLIVSAILVFLLGDRAITSYLSLYTI